ncbi:MAG TPA: 3,4-dihydroxy-2-butanone-4-phosphate synthase, partial [Sphingomonas sp.]|uniref:3,4-dihydroxy-2-butanone-4-phosphate synthase n=1 Tax=Sphingomonas sp. TaxID=28214 RepID=UPI002C9F71AB
MSSNPQLSRLRHAFLSTPEEVIEEARNGRMFILVDDEDRENEGDLIIPAQMATPDAINFMATHGRGLICLAMNKARVDQLGLPLMSRSNGTRHETAFTVSIEAKTGVTTGISAADRARTIAVAVDAANGPDAIVSPGHVFPLVAREGGVLVRAGHTEAAVDVARLAGLNPSGVICEIMNDDGSMSRLDDLVAFAQRHNLKIGTIRDLIAYRRRHDHLVEKRAETQFTSRWGGEWTAISFYNKATGDEQIALVKGKVDPDQPTLVRMHAQALFADMFGEVSKRGGLLAGAMKIIGEEGS